MNTDNFIREEDGGDDAIEASFFTFIRDREEKKQATLHSK